MTVYLFAKLQYFTGLYTYGYYINDYTSLAANGIIQIFVIVLLKIVPEIRHRKNKPPRELLAAPHSQRKKLPEELD